jgi:hypothetical protein
MRGGLGIEGRGRLQLWQKIASFRFSVLQYAHIFMGRRIPLSRACDDLAMPCVTYTITLFASRGTDHYRSGTNKAPWLKTILRGTSEE